MRPNSETIQLGEKSWLVRPLTLGQVRDIETILIADRVSATSSVGDSIKIVSIALRRDHLDDSKAVEEIEATPVEIGIALNQVLQLGGFVEKEPSALMTTLSSQ